MPFEERRRSPRVPVASSGDFTVQTSVAVRLIDVSSAGVLMATSQRVEPGGRGRLRAMLGGNPIQADVEVRHTTTQDEGKGPFRLGARFLSLDSAASRTLGQLLEGTDK
jgi:hypothetical protein